MKIFKYRRSVFSKDGIKNAAADSLAREQHYTIHEYNISRECKNSHICVSLSIRFTLLLSLLSGLLISIYPY